MTTAGNSLTSFAQRLVRTGSVTTHEREVVDVIAEEMRDLSFDSVVVDKFGSIIGTIESGRPGPCLLLDGHCDTVEAKPSDWKHDPWGGEIENGRLYGRGAADMKGSLAAMIHAAGKVDRSRLAGRIAVSATVSEELAEGCAIESVIGHVHPDFVVVGEATRLNLNRGGRGRAEIHLTTLGRSAHSSSPEAGHCAVTDMLRVIEAVNALPVRVDPILGPGSLVLTDIISEPHPGYSVIPYRCHVTYDRRLLPGESGTGLVNSLKSLPGLENIDLLVSIATLEESTYTGAKFLGDKFFPAWVFPESHSFVQAALEGLRSAGLKPEIGAYRFCTNAAFSAGVAGIPTVGFGIAREEDAHTVDESIEVKDLLSAEKGYQGIMYSVCRR